jgi:hypothetical protein
VPSLDLRAALSGRWLRLGRRRKRIAEIRRNRVHLLADAKSSRDDLALHAIRYRAQANERDNGELAPLTGRREIRSNPRPDCENTCVRKLNGR